MPTTLSTFSDQLADAVERGAKSVVSVHARLRLPCSGVHWRDGVIVTTEATVRRDENITVTLPDGRRIPAELKGRDPGTDLAVLSIPHRGIPPPVTPTLCHRTTVRWRLRLQRPPSSCSRRRDRWCS
jgi:S1-C subfamily serine protease